MTIRLLQVAQCRLATKLVKSMNPKRVYINFIVELTALNGRDTLPQDCEVTSLLKY